MEVREMKRANQGIYHFLWADRVSRLRKSTDPRTRVSDLGPTPATSHPHAQNTSTRRAADSGLAPGSGPSPAQRLGEAALGGSPLKRLTSPGLRDKEGQRQTYLEAQPAWVSLLIHSSQSVGGRDCPAEAHSFHRAVVRGAWSFFGVIRFLLSKDTASPQARAEVNRADVLVSLLPKASMVNGCWPLMGASSLHI